MSAAAGEAILVVDDDEQLRDTVSRILEGHGYRCRLASDVHEARRVLARFRHDVVLCDMRMPGESALDLLTYVRGEFPHLPVVMLSGIGELDVAEAALELGAYGWVVKPFDATQVLIAVANALIRARLEKQSVDHAHHLEQAVTARTVELETTVAQLQLSEEHLRHLADHDQLTGLVNRRRFKEELGRELARAERYHLQGAVLSVDIDNFKAINDSSGHAAGDAVLCNVAGVLSKRFRSTDVAARLGGDEFGVLLPTLDAAEARRVAEHLLEALHGRVVEVAGKPSRLTASVGVAILESQDVTVDEVLADADLAMYDAKQKGRDRVVVYSPAEGRAARARAKLRWAQRIQHALEHDRFTLEMQPILDLCTGQFSHGEFLLRMVGERGELIAPGAFLPAAERLGLIHAIDHWVIRRAVQVIAELPHRPRLTVGINLSGASVAGDPALLPLIADELRRSAIDPSELIFELNETAAIANMSEARAFASGLKSLGCGLALDDFGTGFGSFHHLKHLPIDYVKMDGEFIEHLPRSEVDGSIVRAIAEVADSLGVKTVAESVADDETIRLLQKYHVDYAQGFHIGQPAAPAAAAMGGL